LGFKNKFVYKRKKKMNPMTVDSLLSEELWKSAYNKDGLEQMKTLLKNEYFNEKINLDIKVEKEWSSSALWIAVFSRFF
jgi:hypothetical protein